MSTSRILGDISKDSNGFVVRKPKDKIALREVIADQKLKLDKTEKDLMFLREELKAREKHIKVLQDENHQLLQERRFLNGQLTEISNKGRIATMESDTIYSRHSARIFDLEE